MRPNYDHSLITSFMLYLDNRLVDGAGAYTNYTTGLYKQTGYQGNHVWAAPWKSWCYDSCISGVNVPSGFYNSSGQFLTRASGLVIDFVNGRVYSPHNWGPVISGSFARKDYNTYASTEGEVGFVLEHVYGENPDITYSLTGASSKFNGPCIFVTNAQSQNEVFALGGLDNTINTLRAYIVSNSKDNYAQEGVAGMFRDLEERYFSLVPIGAAPFTSSGDLKGGQFCYSTLCDTYGVTNGPYIQATHFIKVSQRSNQATSFAVTIAEVDTSSLRMPRG